VGAAGQHNLEALVLVPRGSERSDRCGLWDWLVRSQLHQGMDEQYLQRHGNLLEVAAWQVRFQLLGTE
jgi:hypothetical protein